MWPFTSSQTIEKSELLMNSIDHHSHLLPGVDDGVQSMDDTLEILANFEVQGVSELWLTPHVMEDIPNSSEGLKRHFVRLKAEYKGCIKLNLAAEYMLDALFETRLADDDILPIGEYGNHILVETSCFNPPMGLYDSLARIKSKGYFPVLAHPERYLYMENSDYRKLKNMGVKFQLNWASLAGRYGRIEQKKAEWLVEKNMYDVVGSDTHGLALSHWNLRIKSSVIKKIKVSSMLVQRREWNL